MEQLLINAGYFFAAGFVLFFVTWILYINIMIAKNKKNLSKVAQLPLIPILIVGYICDVILNVVYATIYYRRLPHKSLNLTFTHRLRRTLRGDEGISEEDYRFKTSLFICKKMLEPWDPGHCGLEKYGFKG